ncbi:hypothetical protein J3E69DRAFT_381341 [Trichoderma sp. SZMC 28015]
MRSTRSTTGSFILSGTTRQPTQKVTGNCSDGDPVSQKASGGRSASNFPNAHFNMHPAKQQKRRATWCEKRGGNTVQYEFNLFPKYEHCTNSCSRKDHKPRERSNPEGKRSKGRLCCCPGCCSTQNEKGEAVWKRRFPFDQHWMTPPGDEKRAVKMARVAKERRLEARLGNAHMGSGLGSVRFMYRDRHCARTVCGVRHAFPHGVSTLSCLGAARNSSQIDDRTPLVHTLPSHHPFHPPKISKVSH